MKKGERRSLLKYEVYLSWKPHLYTHMHCVITCCSKSIHHHYKLWLYLHLFTDLHQHVLLLSPPPNLPPRPNPLQLSSQQTTPPPLPPKSPRLVPAAQRRSGSNPSGDQLQTKLRRLLNADSKENLYKRLWDDDDQDVKTVSL